jgi:hypothetical protein
VTAPRTPLGPLCYTTGDDIVIEWDPDEDLYPGSTEWMRTWSDPLVVVRRGPSRASDLLASSAGDTPTILLGGYTFPDTDAGPGRVVLPTDFTVPVMTWVILSATSTELGNPAGDVERWIECQAKVAGVLVTVVPAQPLTLRAEVAS